MKKSKLFFVLPLALLCSCSFSFTKLEFKRGENALNKNDFQNAIYHFERVILREPESPLALRAAKSGSSVALLETKEYKRALKFLRHIVQTSEDKSERVEAQKKVAHILFENLLDYPAAIASYSSLLQVVHDLESIVDIRINLAKSYFYQRNFFQAEAELEPLFKKELADGKAFEVRRLRANLYFTTKKLEPALKEYNELVKLFPNKSNEENIPMNVVLCLEELKRFDLAVEKLREMRETYPTPEFIDFKINRLLEKKKNLPRLRR